MKSYYLIMILLAVTSLISYLIVRHIVYKTADDVAYMPDVDLNQVKMRLRVLMISVVSKVLFGIGEAAILFFFRTTLAKNFRLSSLLGISALLALLINNAGIFGTGMYLTHQAKEGVLEYPEGFSQTLSVSGFIELIPVASALFFVYALFQLI